ncbi:MAG TPA: DNA-formamidopyrimidine glycosylase [Chloroflexota bacterium]|nr:DNA-formamidopyrimidine glycosylase [Chloroflexota bacterium]
MPELPEVETLRRKLDREVVGQTIASADLLTPSMFEGPCPVADLVGATITGTRRRAKYLILDLSNGVSLIFHLGLAGQIVLEKASAERVVGGHPIPKYSAPLPHKQTHLVLTFGNGDVLFMTDIRKFGHIWLAPTPEVYGIIPDERLGPEIQSAEFTPEEFRRILRARPRAKLKPLLLDQSAVAGLGNIYVDESIWGAGLHPLQTPSQLSDEEIDRLHQSIREVIALALDKGVAELVNNKAIEGHHLPRVHGREGKPCPRCGTPIIRFRVVGRSTYVCEQCQKGLDPHFAPARQSNV